MTIRDIKTISGDFVNGSFDLLTISFDRVKATKYFCNKIQELASINNDLHAKWYFRAALGEFRSALESIGAAFKQLNGSNSWKDSSCEKDMYDQILIKILTRVRNFTVHSSRITGDFKKYFIKRIEGNNSNIEEMRSLFIDHLDKKGNVKGISKVTQEELDWFNRQSETWPANLIIHSAIYESSKFIRAFINQEAKNG